MHAEAVVVLAEPHDRPERPVMDRVVARRAVGEADRDGLPGRAEERAHQPVQHTDGQFGGLAAPGLGQVEPDADRRGGVGLGEVDVQGLVVQVLVAGEDLQRTADVWLLADDQAERPEVGEAPELGEPDAEVLAPGRGRRALEQVRDRRGGRPPVLGVQAGGIQAGVAHHRGRVEAEGSGELDEVVQARVAGQWCRRHASTVPR